MRRNNHNSDFLANAGDSRYFNVSQSAESDSEEPWSQGLSPGAREERKAERPWERGRLQLEIKESLREQYFSDLNLKLNQHQERLNQGILQRSNKIIFLNATFPPARLKFPLAVGNRGLKQPASERRSVRRVIQCKKIRDLFYHQAKPFMHLSCFFCLCFMLLRVTGKQVIPSQLLTTLNVAKEAQLDVKSFISKVSLTS